MTQVQAFLAGNGAANKVNAALEVNGTPNLFLQVKYVLKVLETCSR